ncbi:fumarate reductase [Synechococcus sp. GFB01]|uniref:fumarate reductase n=1 Tax=Synechococcus sp. GFB01 TaxID=1662190 RepID=UPI00064E97EB|nr:fumarate reductase [Synechococcus sp. GFB01]KMM16473.1 fumarate reductase [Synechococcus sp. GFB01]
MKPRRLHRWVVPIAAAPLLLTAASGSIYSLLLEQGIDAFWLLKIHTGRFGPINLQPYYSVVLGLLTLVVIGSGLMVLLQPTRSLSTPARGRGRSSDS